MNNDRPSRFATFVAELRRRHVGRIIIAYGAVAFVLLQAGEIILPAFQAPVWSLRLLVVVVLMGFPIALALAWVYEITPRGIRRTPDIEPAVAGRERPGRLLPRLAFLAVTLVTAAAAGWWTMNWTPSQDAAGLSPADTRLPSGAVRTSTDPSAPIRSLAVLPFEDFSDDPEPDYFAAGMHDALIMQLSQIEALRVVSRTSVMKYAGATTSIPEIAQELGVQGVIEGSVLRADDRVRITVQLIHGPTDTHLWSSSYERELTDIIALQGEVAREISREVQLELTPEEETRFADATPVNPEAADAYLRGRYEQSKGTPEGYEAATRFYQEAVDEDSTFAQAYTGLAGSHLLIGMGDSTKAVDVLPLVLAAAEKAIFWADSSPEAQAVLMEVKAQLGEAFDSLGGEERTIQIKLDSMAVVNEDWLVRVSEFGRQAERIAIAREVEVSGAVAKDRQAAISRRLVSSGDYESAERLLRRMLEHDPSNTAAWDELERLHAVQGDYEGVLSVRRERAGRPDASREEVAAARELERLLGESGNYWEWRLEQLGATEKRGDSVSQVQVAEALVALGEYEEALGHLEGAYEARDHRLGSLFSDPIWDPLRDDRRFIDLLKKIRKMPVHQTPAPPHQ